MNTENKFIRGGGIAGQLIREKNWDQTTLGNIADWPEALPVTINILLGNKLPMLLWWGTELVVFYNDAFQDLQKALYGGMAILGKPAIEVWHSKSDELKALALRVLKNSQDEHRENIELPLNNGSEDEVDTLLFNCTIVYDAQGKASGILATCYDTKKTIAFKNQEETNAGFRELADSLPTLVWTTNEKGDQTFASKQWEIFTGLTPNDNQTFAKMVHPEDLDNILQAWNKSLITKELYKTEVRLKNKNAVYEWFFANGIPVSDKDGKVVKWVGAFTNINEQKKAEAELLELFHEVGDREKKFREMVKQAPIGITIFRGKEFTVEVANEKYLELIDRKEAEFEGKPLFESLPEVKESVEGLLNQVLETGEPYYGYEFPVTLNRYGRADLAYFNFVYQPLREENGDISGVVVVATDVTSSVETRHSLMESEKQFRHFIMQSPIAMTIFRGEDFVIELANNVMFEKIWRRKEADVIGKKIVDAFPELVEQKYPELLKKVFVSGKPHREIEAVAYVMGDDGMNKFYLDFEYAPLFETDKSVSGIMVTVNDVTEQVNARKKVEDAEERLRIALEAAELATWDLDLKTRHLIYSPRLVEIFGMAGVTNVTHKQLRGLIHPGDLKDIVEKAFEKAMVTGVYMYEARIVRKDGILRWIRLQGKVFYEDGVASKIIGILRDITEDKFYEQELQESEQKFRLLADSMPQLIWTGDEKGDLNYFNNAVYEYSGLAFNELQNEGLFQIIYPAEQEEILTLWRQSVASGVDFNFEHRLKRFDGEYRWQLSRAIPQRDADGEIQMWVGTSTDIHEIKELDQQKDYFISMASHELKTPVTSLKGYTQLLLSHYENSGDGFLLSALKIIDKQTFRLSKFISELLDLSKIKYGSLLFDEEDFEVNLFLKEMVSEKRQLNPAYTINFTGGNDALVYADKDRIRQVVANIINNAIKYSPSSTIINVTCEVKNKRVIVSVQDFGIGISKPDQEKIFDRFYRVGGKSQKTYPGFGIGLYIASEIIKRSNGEIGVTSELQKGSTFYFSLPLKKNNN